MSRASRSLPKPNYQLHPERTRTSLTFGVLSRCTPGDPTASVQLTAGIRCRTDCVFSTSLKRQVHSVPCRRAKADGQLCNQLMHGGVSTQSPTKQCCSFSQGAGQSCLVSPLEEIAVAPAFQDGPGPTPPELPSQEGPGLARLAQLGLDPTLAVPVPLAAAVHCAGLLHPVQACAQCCGAYLMLCMHKHAAGAGCVLSAGHFAQKLGLTQSQAG